MKKILAISGSLRAESTNSKIIKSVSKLAGDDFQFSLYKGLSALPAFNPDLDKEDALTVLPEVAELRRQMKESDGVLICTPEYVFAVPGALKNAIDWTVSSGTFIGKPTALITASSLGEKTHESLTLVLKTLEAKLGENSAILISHARTKLNAEGDIQDTATIEAVKLLIKSLAESIGKDD